jgi:hypothetical protein
MLDATCGLCIKHLEQGNLSEKARRMAISQLCEHVVTSICDMTPRYRWNLLWGLRLAVRDAHAFKALLSVVGRKIMSHLSTSGKTHLNFASHSAAKR